MRNLYLFILMIVLSCGDHNQNNEMVSADAALVSVPNEKEMNHLLPPPPPDEESQKESEPQPIPKKIIKKGRLEIEVGDINKSQKTILENLKKTNAYNEGEFFSNSEEQEMLKMTIRVPNQNFDALMQSFGNDLGNVISKNVGSEDVTEEYTDVTIRLENKLTYLEKYRELVKKSTSTKDILEIQEKIRGLEEEIESSKGRLKFIDDRVKYSTLELTLIKNKPRNSVTSKIGFGSQFTDSVAEGWNNFVGFILGLISFWPFLLIIPIVIFVIRKWRKRKMEAKQ